MALSYYTNWSDNNAAVPLFRPPSPVPELFSFHEDPTFYDTGINPIFEQSYTDYSNTVTPTRDVFNTSPEFQVSSFTYQDPYYTLPELARYPVENKGRLSAQSMAAKVRRRRISEKTQELGKMVPGGHKMNTAEMFKAGFEYIKFLQAQIGVLKLMHSLPESEEVMSNGEMQALVTCTMMQEKLYTEGKCIGPNTWQKPSK